MSGYSFETLMAEARYRLGTPPVYYMPGSDGGNFFGSGPVYHVPGSGGGNFFGPGAGYYVPGSGQGNLFGAYPMGHPLAPLCHLTSVASLVRRQDASCQTDDVVVVGQGAAVIPVAARLERVQQAVSCQTVSPSPVQVGAGEGSSSMIVGESSDGRGRHFQKRVEDNEYTNPSKWSKYWADKRKEVEAKYLADCAAEGQEADVPWVDAVSAANTGNKNKCLYFWLKTLAKKGILVLLEGLVTQGFFGITKFVVPKATRPEFDAGDFPSVSSIGPHKKRYKEMGRTWQIAGFRETVDPVSGDLTFVYDANLQKRVRAQFNDTRLRHMARVAKELEEKAGV